MKENVSGARAPRRHLGDAGGARDGTWTTATIVSRRATFSFSRCIRIARFRLRFRSIGNGWSGSTASGVRTGQTSLAK